MDSELDLLLPDTENEAGAPQGAPRIIERSPRNLIGEARLGVRCRAANLMPYGSSYHSGCLFELD